MKVGDLSGDVSMGREAAGDPPLPPELVSLAPEPRGHQYLIYGPKGSGKTFVGVGIGLRYVDGQKTPDGRPYKVYHLIADGVSGEVVRLAYPGAPIVQLDITKGFRFQESQYLQTAVQVFNQIGATLQAIEKQGDCGFIVWDGVENLVLILEGVGRARGGWPPIGKADWSVWRYRRDELFMVWDRMKRVAKFGMSFGMYEVSAEILREGQLWATEESHKVVDYLVEGSHVVLRAIDRVRPGEGARHFCLVKTAKAVVEIEGKAVAVLDGGKLYELTGWRRPAIRGCPNPTDGLPWVEMPAVGEENIRSTKPIEKQEEPKGPIPPPPGVEVVNAAQREITGWG